ncbi:MAG TPA: alpha-amylase family glycosyl hydrolase [Spirochaetota bacterium]|nr:alpha-amylase family glycosyl hydrolase [Spirochaetota bacterium]
MPFDIQALYQKHKSRITGGTAVLLGLCILCLIFSSGTDQNDPSLGEYPSIKPLAIDGSSRWLFSWKDESGTAHDVLLLGNFISKGQPVTRIQMYDENGDGVWRCLVELDPGQYAYKFLVNKNLLVPPSHVDVLERTMNGAGQVFVPNGDAPWVSSISPADESTTTSFSNITFTLSGNLGTLNMGDVRVSLNGKPLPVSVDRENARFTAKVEDPAEGQFLLQISGQDTAGNAILEYQSIFFYYRSRISEIEPTGLDGALAYRVLIPAFTATNSGNGLAGLISRLDYLNDGKGEKGKSLGIKLLVLYGILPSSDAWGGEITSFERTRQGLGDRSLLGVLASECRKRGIRIIVHFNLAYISNQHEFFQETYGNPGSNRWDWFFFMNDTGTRYLGYADDPSLPRLNTSSETASTYLLDIVRNWAASGIDGFLFEHADLLPEAWWKRVRDAARTGSGKPDLILAGSCHGSGDYVNQLFQGKFSVAESLNHATDLALAFAGNRPEEITTGIGSWEAAIPRGGAFLRPTANRDMPRLASIHNDTMRSRAALGFLLTGGGVPMIQWGDELDLRSPDPPVDRDPSPMDWSSLSNKQADPESTFNLVRNLASLRRTWPELRRDLDGGRPVLRWMTEKEFGYSAWVRQSVPNRFFLGIMLFNRGRKEASPEFVLPITTTPDGHYRGRDILMPSLQTVVAKVKDGKLSDITLPVKPERGFQLWLFERLTTSE